MPSAKDLQRGAMIARELEREVAVPDARRVLMELAQLLETAACEIEAAEADDDELPLTGLG